MAKKVTAAKAKKAPAKKLVTKSKKAPAPAKKTAKKVGKSATSVAKVAKVAKVASADDKYIRYPDKISCNDFVNPRADALYRDSIDN